MVEIQKNVMVELTQEQKTLLKEIVNDRFAIGPFSGMVFNALISQKSEDIDGYVKLALDVRLRLKQLSQ